MGAWVRGCVRGCVGAWVRGCVRGCVGGCVGACVRGCVGAWVRACVGACVGACVRGCVRARARAFSVRGVFVCELEGGRGCERTYRADEQNKWRHREQADQAVKWITRLVAVCVILSS